MQNTPDISLIIPLLNEEESLLPLHNWILNVFYKEAIANNLYNKIQQEVLLYEWDFITDNLDSYMSGLLLEVFMVVLKGL